MKTYLQTMEEVLKELDSGREGLSQTEADKRLEKNGKNKLDEARKDSLAVRLFNQLKDPMIVILIAAAIISGITAAYSGESFADVIIIMAVVIINSILGVLPGKQGGKSH